MPELPDVEVYRRYLNATALHQRIAHTEIESPSLLKDTTTPQGLGRTLKGKSFESTRRHGKYLLVALTEDGWLVLHFGMTGELKYFENRDNTPDHTRLLITFDNGYHLAYIAPRKLGRITPIGSPREFIRAQRLGPDALDVEQKDFLELAGNHHGMVKAWLMDQHCIAGIGNIYSDEILYQAGIHPQYNVNELDTNRLRQLYKNMRQVLQAAIDAGADPEKMPDIFLLRHRQTGEVCPKCGTAVARIHAAGRTAWYCPHCQPADDD